MDIPLDEVIHFDAITSTPSTGAAVDADAAPTFAVYEEATDTDIGVGGNMTKRTSLTGNYRGTFTLSAANGFEVGKWYNVIGTGVVGGVTGKAVLKSFRVVAAEAIAGKPKVDVDALLGTAWLTPGTAGTPDVNVKLISDDAAAANTLELFAEILDQSTGQLDSGSFAADTVLAPIRTGTAQAGGASTITLDVGASATNDWYNDKLIYLTGGTGVGQVVWISDYVGGTQVATVKPAWITVPDNTTTFAILPAASVFHQVLADHVVTGSVGAGINAASSAGDPWATALPGAYGAGTAGKIVGDNVNATISSRATSSALATAQADLDIITGADGALLATDSINSASVAASAVTEFQSGLASQASVDTLATYVDTEVAALVTELAKVPKSDGTATWNATALASIQTEANDALVANNLDHLVLSAVDTNFATTVHDDSVIGHLAHNGTGAAFDRTTDSLEALDGDLGALATTLNTIGNIVATSGVVVDSFTAAADTELQTAAAAALTAYDGPTTAEMEARTLVAADYATAASQTSQDTEIAEIQTTLAGLFTTALTESYRADGATGTVAQLLYEINQTLGERSISGTTVTVKKVDGTTTAFGQTLNDASTPTSITHAA